MKVSKNILSLLAILALVGWGGGTALANGIFLNGVRVNGLKNHSFKNCEVKFSPTGDVYITAKGFKIKAIPQNTAAAPPPTKIINTPAPAPKPLPRPVPPPKPAPAPKPKPAPNTATAPEPGTPTVPPGPITKRYFMVAIGPPPPRTGFAQFDVDIYINRKWIRKVRNKEQQVVFEVTKFLQRGKNMVHFAATKNYDGKARQSTSPNDFVRIVIGSGTRGGGTVNITESMADFKASADKTTNFNEEQTFVPK